MRAVISLDIVAPTLTPAARSCYRATSPRDRLGAHPERVNMSVRLAICLSVAALGAACHPRVIAAGVTATATAAATTSVRITSGIAAGASVDLPAGALPDGATVRMVAAGLPIPPGFAAVGPALRIEISAPLAGAALATVRIPFDPCLQRAQGATDADLLLLRGAGTAGPPDVVVNLDRTITILIGATDVLQAIAPEGTPPLAPPFAALGRGGLGLDPDGDLFVWGDGDPLPRPLTLPSGAISVESGDGFSLALMPDGEVLSWGTNFAGQLGSGDFAFRDTPAAVVDLACVTRIAVGPGAANALALTLDGDLLAWGRLFGEDRSRPVRLDGIERPRDFAATRHWLIALADGSVLSMGANERGQLGQGDTVARASLLAVPGLARIVAVAAGLDFSLALDEDGAVWAFGSNVFGQLGDGTFADRHAPVRIGSLPPVVAIAAATRTALALDAAGALHVWGAGGVGQLATGDFRVASPVPLPVPPLPAAVAGFDGGIDAFIVALGDGSHAAWGLGASGVLGNGTLANRNLPTPLRPFGP